MQVASQPAVRAAVSGGEEPSELEAAFESLKRAYRTDPSPSYETRLRWLEALERTTQTHRKEIADAITADFGNRSFHETQIAEIFTLITGLKYLRGQLKGWMKPRSRHVMLAFLPGRAKVHYQPRGVVGIISPWNYPFQLAVGPLAAALAAGNRVLLKPSEYTPRTSALLARLIGQSLDPSVVRVITGGAEVGAAFSKLPFDHLLFTGSTQVGRQVMRAAAENLTPVTLELGGKSPAIVHESFPTERAAQRIVAGKWFNAGQTCIAPDYALVSKAQRDAFVTAMQVAVGKSYPTLADNRDYTSIINDKHYDRLNFLIDDAVARGAKKVELNPAAETLDPSTRKIAPTLLLDVDDSMAVMQEEIFGPVLPVVTHEGLDDAIEYVNARPRPLALYYFDFDEERGRKVLERTVSGGASINDTLMHFACDDLPFGGVGPSGIGAYHGIEGFETFSHKKGVFYQARFNGAAALAPPYGAKLERLLSLFVGK